MSVFLLRSGLVAELCWLLCCGITCAGCFVLPACLAHIVQASQCATGTVQHITGAMQWLYTRKDHACTTPCMHARTTPAMHVSIVLVLLFILLSPPLRGTGPMAVEARA
jgi:hypothetical protein